VEIRQCAAAAEAGEVTFTAADEFRAQGSLREEAVQGRQHKVTVRSEPLDNLSIHNTALVKIDVQGSEFLVLQGMRRLLEERRVDAISFELERDLLGDDFRDLMTFLHGLSDSGARFFVPLANGRDRLISPELTELEQARKLSQVVIDFTDRSHPRFGPTKAIRLNAVCVASQLPTGGCDGVLQDIRIRQGPLGRRTTRGTTRAHPNDRNYAVPAASRSLSPSSTSSDRDAGVVNDGGELLAHFILNSLSNSQPTSKYTVDRRDRLVD
jgi:hypothetical protein